MSAILLIRHGQSANNAQPEHLRVCDPGLTDAGVHQAAVTAKHLQGAPIERLYCSPFLRSLETTRPIAQATGLAVNVRADIFEQGGCYSGYDRVGKRGEPGMGRRQLATNYAGWHIDDAIEDTGWWNRDFETPAAAWQRAQAVARWLFNELARESVMSALVIHADFKYLLLSALTQNYASRIFEADEPLYNVGITQVDIQGDTLELTQVNSVAHLPNNLVTS